MNLYYIYLVYDFGRPYIYTTRNYLSKVLSYPSENVTNSIRPDLSRRQSLKKKYNLSLRHTPHSISPTRTFSLTKSEFKIRVRNDRHTGTRSVKWRNSRPIDRRFIYIMDGIPYQILWVIPRIVSGSDSFILKRSRTDLLLRKISRTQVTHVYIPVLPTNLFGKECISDKKKYPEIDKVKFPSKFGRVKELWRRTLF